MFIIFLSLLFSAIVEAAYSPDILASVPSVDFCNGQANKTDVVYYIFKSSNQTTAITIDDDYSLPRLDKNFPVKMFIHGYISNATSPWFKPLKDAYFRKGHHTIIYIDWSKASSGRYEVASANIFPVGEYIADFILSLRIPLKNVHLIGHSLGSHLAGFVGKHVFWKTGNRIGRITGTDPAGPAFEKVGPSSRLNETDAEFVDVIHTDIKYFGIKKPCGHVDYYANGGAEQPGCQSHDKDVNTHNDAENCHHARSNLYFIESVNRTDVTAKLAKFNEKGEVVVTSSSQEIVFGDLVPTFAKGIYYFSTNSEEPFLISKNKVNPST